MALLYVDIESYSSALLPDVGAFRYSEHPDTGLLGIGVLLVPSLEHAHEHVRAQTLLRQVEIIHCHRHERLSPAVQTALRDSKSEVLSWGSFDRILLDEAGLGARFGWPAHAGAAWLDVMDVARACNLPAGLDVAARAVGLAEGEAARKDKRGKRLLDRYAMPQKDGTRRQLDDNPDDSAILLDQYLPVDVALLARLHAVLPPLSAQERRVAEATWRMNRKGVRIDQELAAVLLQVHAWLHANAQQAATERHQLNIQAPVQVMAALKGYGFPLPDHRKTGQPSIEQKLIGRVLERLGEAIDPRARDLLELRFQCNGTSLAKAGAALSRICRDGRVRDQFVYCGTLTNRWASREIQLQNLARPRFDMTALDVDTLTSLFKSCSDPAALQRLVAIFFGVGLQDAAVSLLRSLIIPEPGNVLIVADYAMIEVVTNWLAAAEWGGLAALQAGQDEYRNFAATLLSRIEALLAGANDPDSRRNLEIARDLVAAKPRMLGKVGILSIQYGSAPHGLAAQSNIPVALASMMIDEYNRRYPAVAIHQQTLVSAAVAVMQSVANGTPTEYRVPPLDIRFRYRPPLPGTSLDMLEMVRPSGESVRYLRPKLTQEHRRGMQRQVISHQIFEVGEKHYRRDLKLTDQAENCASSLARDLVATAIVTLVEADLVPVLAVHDELGIEVPAERAAAIKQAIKSLLEAPPSWWDPRAPLRTESTIVTRYQKI